MAPLQDLLRYLIDRSNGRRVFLVGIDGGAGSGKSNLSRWLGQNLRGAGVPAVEIHGEKFFLPAAQRAGLGDVLDVVGDLDWKRLRDAVLVPLRLGAPARYQMYEGSTDALGAWATIPLGGVTIVDGVSATRSELSQYYDLRIWFSCPPQLRAAHLRADGKTAPAEIARWLASEEDFFASDNPEPRAHVVFEQSADGLALKKWAPPGVE